MSFGPSVRNGLGIGLGPTATLATAFSQATLDFNFIDNLVFPTDITFTRASSATMFDSSGTLIFAPMNAIRNNTMQGAVAGTPGTLPTNWALDTPGLTTSVVGTGVSNGISYIDVRISGTTGAGYGNIFFETTSGIAATNGQTWSHSLWLSVAAGSTTNVSTIRHAFDQYSSVPAYLATVASNLTGISSSLVRFSAALTTNNASTAYVRPSLSLLWSVGVAIDITLRIGMPQLQRGSTATAVNATSGTAYQGPRFDYDPSTLALRGLLIEESRTNSIRNNTMQGAVAGTPGTLPTNWAISGLGTLTQTVVGTGTANGITYIDLRFSGTTSTTSVSIRHEPGGTGGVAAANGQSWAQSAWTAVIAGSTTNITQVGLSANIYDSGEAFLASVPYTNFIANTTSTLTRVTPSGTIATVGTAFIQPQIYLTFSSGVAIDITLRIGLPQLELGAFATSVIPTTTTATTRSADVASVNTLSPWYNAAEGTLYAEAASNQPLNTPASVANGAVAINDNSTNNRLDIRLQSGGSSFVSFVSSGGSNVATLINSGTYAPSTTYKSALAYAVNDYARVTNGGTVATDTLGALPIGVNQMRIGQLDAGTSPLNGHIRRITYYPRRLSNAELQAITA